MLRFLNQFTNPDHDAPGPLSGWRWLVCYVCILGMSLPMASMLPLNLMQQFRMQSEEEVHTGDASVIGAMEERRRFAIPPHVRVLPPKRHTSARLSLQQRAASDHSEYRSINGTGAPLRC